MAPASAIMNMKRMPMASSLLRRLNQSRTLPSSASFPRRTIHSRSALSLSSLPSQHYLSSRQSLHQTHRTRQYQENSVKHFSSLAQEVDGDDDDGNDGELQTGDGGGGGGHNQGLLPTRHSRNLPPPVCPPAQLRAEVEALFDAPVGSLIVYSKPALAGGGAPKSAAEEMTDAYYAADAAVQRAEYVMRGLNAALSPASFVARSVRRGAMVLEGDAAAEGGPVGGPLAAEECFCALLDLLERLRAEGASYAELRTRVRSQLIDPTSVEEAGSSSDSDSSDSSGSSSDDSDSDSDDDDKVDEAPDHSFNEWAESIEQSMKKAKITNPRNTGGMNGFSSTNGAEEEADADVGEDSPELYQFGADPGVTTHMYDLILDSLACLVDADASSSLSAVDLVEIMPEEHPSPPELAKYLLDHVLHRHRLDGGDIGLGGGAFEQNPFNAVGKGIGIGAGTGAGALADAVPFNTDVRTCPTTLTFNAVLRVAAHFDPVAHAEAAENARVLGGDWGNDAASTAAAGGGAELQAQEKARLRDVTLDAALSTFSRMQDCAALTLRTLHKSTKKATSRSALKAQAKLLAGNYKGKANNNRMSGRNSATYSYVIQTLRNCIPPSLSRGNMTFGLYHKGCVQEGVMDARLVETMRSVGGYGGEGGLIEGDEGGDAGDRPPPVSNGPLFDAFMAKELGCGSAIALEKGRKLRQDRNYKLRRHVEWDDTY